MDHSADEVREGIMPDIFDQLAAGQQPASNTSATTAPTQTAATSPANSAAPTGDVFDQLAAGKHPSQTQQSDQSSKPNAETGGWAGVKRNTVRFVSNLYHAFSDPATEKEKQGLMMKVQAEKEWQKAHGYDPNEVDERVATNPSRATLAYHRLIDAPASHLQAKGHDEEAAARDLLSKGETFKGVNLYASGLADKTLAAIPMIGPAINSIAERYESGDKSGAATDLAA